jgi:hypothetical protein
MSNFFETDSVCDSDNSTESINYNDLTADEKAEADDYKRFFEKDKYVIRRRLPNNTDKSRDPKANMKAYYNKKITIYSTRHTPRSNIRDPVYGTFTKDKVGTKDEYKYFKVRMADFATEDRTPLTLFYDSPEGYEKHQHTRVSMDIKNKWHDRRTKRDGFATPRF